MPTRLLHICAALWLYHSKNGKRQNCYVKIKKGVGSSARDLKFAFSSNQSAETLRQVSLFWINFTTPALNSFIHHSLTMSTNIYPELPSARPWECSNEPSRAGFWEGNFNKQVPIWACQAVADDTMKRNEGNNTNCWEMLVCLVSGQVNQDESYESKGIWEQMGTAWQAEEEHT